MLNILSKSLFVSLLLFFFSVAYFPLSATTIEATKFDSKISPDSVEPLNSQLKVVYFYGKGAVPHVNWEERLDRTLKDVSQYYVEEFAKHGQSTDGIPFETTEDGRVKIHTVEGQKESTAYGIHSAAQIEREIASFLAENIDLNQDHILVITGLSYKDELGRYIFHSPYYGRGSAKSGLCMVVDCEVLDAAYLTDRTSTMVFTEMNVENKSCSVAEFNSWYIGGIAHELGHLFGLWHDYGHPSEQLEPNFISLMGEFGSRHYRDNLWNSPRTSMISKAGIQQLASHPLFTHQKKPIVSSSRLLLHALDYDDTEEHATLRLNYESDTKPYGVVALRRPLHLSEYRSDSYWSNDVYDTYAEITLPQLKAGKAYEFVLLFLFQDGTVSVCKNIVTSSQDKRFSIVENYGTPILAALKLRLEKHAFQQELALSVVQHLLDRAPTIDLDSFDGNAVFLSDVKWEEASVGWEVPARNYFSSESESRFFLVNKGQIYEKGLYAHGPSVYRFGLAGNWKTLKAVAGLRDGAHEEGGAQFFVVGDGKVLASSPQLKANEQFVFEVDVAGVQHLELQARDAEGHNHNAWAIWCAPLLSR